MESCLIHVVCSQWPCVTVKGRLASVGYPWPCRNDDPNVYADMRRAVLHHRVKCAFNKWISLSQYDKRASSIFQSISNFQHHYPTFSSHLRSHGCDDDAEVSGFSAGLWTIDGTQALVDISAAEVLCFSQRAPPEVVPRSDGTLAARWNHLHSTLLLKIGYRKTHTHTIRSVFTIICVSISIYLYIYIYVYLEIHVYTYAYMHIYIYMHIDRHTHTHICTYVYKYKYKEINKLIK